MKRCSICNKWILPWQPAGGFDKKLWTHFSCIDNNYRNLRSGTVLEG